jgi:hypothetical protein
MISFPAALQAVGGARTGVAPVNLLDVSDLNGNFYYWSDRRISAPFAIADEIPGNITLPVAIPAGQAVLWILPTKAVLGGTGGTGTVSLSGCQLQIDAGGAFSSGIMATWSGFKAAGLPPGAAIQAAYSVAAVEEVAEIQGDADFINNLGAPTGGNFNSQYHAGVTPTVAGIESASLYAQLLETVDVPVEIQVTVSFIGIAIYYNVPGSSIPGGQSPLVSNGYGPYQPWLLSVPKFTFHRSLQTDMGAFKVQNLSGTTLARDVDTILRAGTLEGALFVWRLWQPDAQAAWRTVQGTLTLDPRGEDNISLKGTQLLNPSQDDTPLEIYCETCQLQWAGPRCGATGETECSYSFQSCQVVERIMVTMNDYEKNYGEAIANTAQQVINRARKF